MTLNKSAFVILMLVLIVLPCVAQTRIVDVQTNLGSANVFVDGEWMGLASKGSFSVAEDAETLVVSPHGGDAWTVQAMSFDLLSAPGASISVDATFPYYYRIESVPPGASIFFGDHHSTELTPVTLERLDPIAEQIEILLEGFEPAYIEPGQDIWNRTLVELRPVASMEILTENGFVVKRKNRRWINYTAATAAFIGGALSIHFRTKADNRFDDFGETGNRSLKSDIRRLDMYSGVALGVMQAGVGVIALRLAL